jgi:putative peptidoglycan lipid II flippase
VSTEPGDDAPPVWSPPERPASPTVVRPRTIGALGAPEPLAPATPWLSPPVDDGADLIWQPPTGRVPAVAIGAALSDPDVWSLEPDELEIVATNDDPLAVLDAIDHLSPTDVQAEADAEAEAAWAEHDPRDDTAATAAVAPTATINPPRRQGLLRSNLIVASGTAVSRLTGFVRTFLIIYVLYKGLGDAFIGANNTPNMIYELILGGILTASLVPLFSDDLERGDGQEATSAIISFALVALLAVTLVGLVGGPILVFLFSTGSDEVRRQDYFDVAVPLALLFAPQIFFYGLMAVWSAVLNARRRFLAAAWAPVLNNLIAIATLVYAGQLVSDQLDAAGVSPTRARNDPGLSLQAALDDRQILWVLGIGTTLGIAVMALSLYPALRRSGFRFTFRLRYRHPAVQRAIRLSAWTLGYVIANQIAVIVIQILTGPSSGDASKYQVSYQYFQLPHALLAVSIMVTFEPILGRADSRGDLREFNEQLLLGFRLIGLLIIPAAVGYVALPKGLDAITFDPGTNSVLGIALSLTGIIAAFAVGLPGFSTYLYALRGFYAKKNTKIPFFINCIENAINIVLAIVFVRWWSVVGLALAFAAAYSISAILAVVVLGRHSPGFDWRGLVQTWLKLLVAACIMGGFVYGFVSFLAPSSALMVLPVVLGGVLIGAITYFASIYALHVPGISELMTRLPGLRRFA